MKDSNLEIRHDSEIAFHDEKYAKQKKKKNYYDMGFNSLIATRMWEMVGDIKDKHVIDYGCGSGWTSKKLAQKGAEVWAFDISEEAVKLTREKARSEGLEDRVHAEQMPAEKLAYKSNQFDLVIGTAILHHLDLDIAIREIHRVLKKDGKAYFMEPLRHNPLINIFRWFTPHMRTKDELPLHFNDFKQLSSHFSKFEHEEFYLITLMSFFWYFIIRNEYLFLKTRNILFKFDRILLKMIPWVRKYCWYSILIMQK